MKVLNASRVRNLRRLAFLKKVGTFVCGAFFILCFITGCYNICHRPLSGFVHSVILDDRYDDYNYSIEVSDQITFYENGSHGYLKSDVTGKLMDGKGRVVNE